MRQFLLLAPFFLYAFSNPAIADLGAAENTTPRQKESKQTLFDAWCIEKYADCVVQLENGRLSVDDSPGITINQLLNWSKTDKYKYPEGLFNFIGPHHLYTYIFKYRDSNGKLKEAKIVFQNSKYSDKFYSLLKTWARSKERRCTYNFEERKMICQE